MTGEINISNILTWILIMLVGYLISLERSEHRAALVAR